MVKKCVKKCVKKHTPLSRPCWQDRKSCRLFEARCSFLSSQGAKTSKYETPKLEFQSSKDAKSPTWSDPWKTLKNFTTWLSISQLNAIPRRFKSHFRDIPGEARLARISSWWHGNSGTSSLGDFSWEKTWKEPGKNHGKPWAKLVQMCFFFRHGVSLMFCSGLLWS